MLLQKIVGLVALFVAAPALSCQYEFAPEPVGGPSAKFLAGKMGAAATFIDLAVVEGASDVRGPDGKISNWSKAISFRVIDHWKGQSVDRFILFGGLADSNDPGWSLGHWVDDQGRIDPYESVREATVLMPQGMTSCDPPALMAKPGQTYVVLREADGRLLGAVQFHAGAAARRGTAIAAAPAWPNDDWARQLSYQREAGPAPPVAAETDPTRAIVKFRRLLKETEVSRLTGEAKAAPYAATVVRSGVLSDYRLGSEIAFPGLVADAARWASARSTDRAFVKAQAAAIVDAVAVRDLASDSAWQTYARSVLAVADSPLESGQIFFASVDVIADAAAQRTLASNPAVAEVTPARLVRGRVAIGRVRSTAPPLPPLTAIEAYRRLTTLAGKDLPESAIIGRWRMTGGDSLEFGKQVFTLDLRDGRAVAEMPCARSEGSYRFAGRVLELQLTKPDLSACPKNQDYWYPAFLFDSDGVMTVMITGETLEAVHNGGTFHFRREAM